MAQRARVPRMATVTALPATYRSSSTSPPNARALVIAGTSFVRSRTIETPTLDPSADGLTTSDSLTVNANVAPTVSPGATAHHSGVGRPSVCHTRLQVTLSMPIALA